MHFMGVVPIFLVKHHPVYHPLSPPLRSVMGFLCPFRGAGAAQAPSPPRFLAEHPRIPGRAQTSLPRTGRRFHHIHPPTALSFPSFPIHFKFDFLVSLLLNLSPGPRAGLEPVTGGVPDGAGAAPSSRSDPSAPRGSSNRGRGLSWCGGTAKVGVPPPPVPHAERAPPPD